MFLSCWASCQNVYVDWKCASYVISLVPCMLYLTELFFNSTKGRLIVLCLEHVQNSDSGSITFCSKAGSTSQRTSPFREIVGYATEQLSSSSLCSSPDDTSCDGVKLEETESWQLRLAYSTTWPGMVLAICTYLDRYFLASAGNYVSCYVLFFLSFFCDWFSSIKSYVCMLL